MNLPTASMRDRKLLIECNWFSKIFNPNIYPFARKNM